MKHDTLSEEESRVYLFGKGFPDAQQSAYFRKEAIEHYHYIFNALIQVVKDTWEHEENVIIKAVNDNGEIVEYSSYSFALDELCRRQFRSMNLEAKKKLHDLYEKEQGIAQIITTPVSTLTVFKEKGMEDEVGVDMTKLDGYNRHFDQIFSVVREIYEGKITKEDVEDYNVSLLSRYIMYNYPKIIHVADYYHELNRQRILLKQANDDFFSFTYITIDQFEIDLDEIVENYYSYEGGVEKSIRSIFTKINEIIENLKYCNNAEREEKGLKLRKIIQKVKRLEN